MRALKKILIFTDDKVIFKLFLNLKWWLIILCKRILVIKLNALLVSIFLFIIQCIINFLYIIYISIYSIHSIYSKNVLVIVECIVILIITEYYTVFNYYFQFQYVNVFQAECVYYWTDKRDNTGTEVPFPVNGVETTTNELLKLNCRITGDTCGLLFGTSAPLSLDFSSFTLTLCN